MFKTLEDESIAVLLLTGLALTVGYVVLKKAGLLEKGALNPASQNNVVNQAANDAYQNLTGSKGTIGSDSYDVLGRIFDPNYWAAKAATSSTTPAPAAATTPDTGPQYDPMGNVIN